MVGEWVRLVGALAYGVEIRLRYKKNEFRPAQVFRNTSSQALPPDTTPHKTPSKEQVAQEWREECTKKSGAKKLDNIANTSICISVTGNQKKAYQLLTIVTQKCESSNPKIW